ncbi:capsular polysaccharide export protein [Yoonia litorea]|uniref:Capsular polysaccharide export protein n=1 Tax=Yoonia litorea TaxID=1123755 RepID=A0A1I6LLV3_9RHOB|nr:capsular biosynthesis protein [Yoonia litorea]SFS04242.1 capsular polysaccharide export protein [Yoonia litorea]
MASAVTRFQKGHSGRRFLFLQGPHGPFFRKLAGMLRETGADVWRVGFNAGDRAFWGRAPGYLAFQDDLRKWPQTCKALLQEKHITDIVLYGDTRPVHAEAIKLARTMGICIHVFEEGYMRPYWVTYERDGSNGHSALMRIDVGEMRDRLARSDIDMPTPPAQWGDMRQHIFYGAAYHWFVMFWNHRYPSFKTHRALPVRQEAALYTKRLLLMPFLALERRWRTRRIKAGGYPYHIALLQLEHDASFQAHSPFATMQEFISLVVAGFADGAPSHHHLVFKAHPLENGRAPLRRLIEQEAQKHGIRNRVHYLRGGKLAQVLTEARSAVTVNSTAGQQALWRGIPLKAFGTAVYNKPEFISDQPLAAFFANPKRPDAAAYRDYRQFLLETSQVPGGFYSSSGRRQLLRMVVDMMLQEASPYDALVPTRQKPPAMRVVGRGSLD